MESKRQQIGPSPLGVRSSVVGLGGTFAAAIILFMLAGWLLDRWLSLTPLFTLVGTAVGAVLGFLNVYWKIQAEIEEQKAEKAEQKGRR